MRLLRWICNVFRVPVKKKKIEVQHELREHYDLEYMDSDIRCPVTQPTSPGALDKLLEKPE